MEEKTNIVKITDLPDEILGLIFKRLSQTEALNTRLVCPEWKEEIDSHYSGWVIQLDDRSPFFQHILRLRMKECKVIRLVDPLPTLVSQVSFFRHPDLIKEIEVMEDFDQYEQIISPQNLHRMLKFCSKNLDDLVLSLTDDLLNNPHHSDSDDVLDGYTFENLQKLEIIFQKEMPDDLTPLFFFRDMEDNMFYRLMVLSTMPKLKSLTVTPNIGLSPDAVARVSYDVLSFVAKHGPTLQHIVYTNHWEIQDDPFDVDDRIQDIDLVLLKKVNCLETLHLSLENEKVSFLKSAWKVLLECQTKLQDLQVYCLPFPSTMFRNLMLTNFETIKSVEIDSLTVLDVVFENGAVRRVCDMSFFGNCLNLEELTLTSDTLTTQQDAGRRPELRELSKLPAMFKLLSLSSFMIRSDDVLEFSRSHRQLASVTCINCWSPGDGSEYGINASIIEELLNEQNVHLKQIEICQSHQLGDLDELKNLTAVLDSIGVPPFDNITSCVSLSLFRFGDPVGEWQHGYPIMLDSD